MAKQVSERDYRRIKAAQNAGRSVEKVVKQLNWSDRTVRRVFKSTSFTAFKRQIAKDTAGIKAARQASKTKKTIKHNTFQHRNAAGQYIATPISDSKVPKPPGLLRRAIAKVRGR